MDIKFLFGAIFFFFASIVGFVLGFEEPDFFITSGVTLLLAIGFTWATFKK